MRQHHPARYPKPRVIGLARHNLDNLRFVCCIENGLLRTEVGNRLLKIMRDTIPSLPVMAVSSSAINTAFHAAEALVETFIAQLFDARLQLCR